MEYLDFFQGFKHDKIWVNLTGSLCIIHPPLPPPGVENTHINYDHSPMISR